MGPSTQLADRLSENLLHRKFVEHSFFKNVDAATLTSEQVAVFVGQWWHPLHYFPTFLARSVAVLPDVAAKSAITRILNQEIGGGNPKLAHEVIYVDTMEKAGFGHAVVTDSPPFSETVDLVAGYERASAEHLSTLGFIFATEVTDLLMVSSIGTAVEHATGVSDLEWVRIHVEQEPDHVEEANHSLLQDFGPEDEAAILKSAEEMWTLWHRFFDRLGEEIGSDAL
jgi:pyrroloquinoline quinone (PQQ) biosynthesis protein C